jgi:hypothetical protein
VGTLLISASATTVALRYAALNKRAVSHLQVLSDTFRPVKGFISEDPRKWKKFLVAAMAYFNDVSVDLIYDPTWEFDHLDIEVNTLEHGYDPTGIMTVEYPDLIELVVKGSLDLEVVLAKLATQNLRLFDDPRGFIKAIKRWRERDVKALAKYLSFLMKRDIHPESALERLSDFVDEHILEETEPSGAIRDSGTHGATLKGFSTDLNGTNLDWEAEIRVTVGSVDVDEGLLEDFMAGAQEDADDARRFEVDDDSREREYGGMDSGW